MHAIQYLPPPFHLLIGIESVAATVVFKKCRRDDGPELWFISKPLSSSCVCLNGRSGSVCVLVMEDVQGGVALSTLHGSKGQRRQRQACRRDKSGVQEAVCLEDEVVMVLVPRAVICIGIENQLRIRDVLRKVERVDRVTDEFVIAADDQSGLFDVLEVS